MAMPADMRSDLLMRHEWEAWQIIVKELDAIGIDINKNAPLAAALTNWGDALVALRRVVP